MSYFNGEVKLANKVWIYYAEPAAADSMFKGLPSSRDVVAELTQARNAYQLVVGQELQGVGFYEELAAQAKDEGRARLDK